MKRRYFPKKDKKLPKGYDSWLEHRLHQTVLKDTCFHPSKDDWVPYKIEHNYEPDFIFKHGDTLYIAETKGRAMDSAEMRKYLFVREHLTDWKVFKESGCKNVELFFIFEKAATPMPHSKKRKDGTRQSHGQWATKNKFRWLCEHSGHLKNILTKQQLIDTIDHYN